MRSAFQVIIYGACFWLLGFLNASTAHDVRPAFLSAVETAPANFTISWTVPQISGRAPAITPEFPHDCTSGPVSQQIERNATLQNWTLICDLSSGEINFRGLANSTLDVFVDIRYENGQSRSDLIQPDSPVMILDQAPRSPARAYLGIGIDHIIYGWDHLLFVLGLVLLVRPRQIWAVATTFTLAHSITLGLAALGWLSLPTRPVEILIALSIVLLGVEIIKKYRGTPSLGARRPYLVSFLIGLIHGCGFASALSSIGLPKGTELLALFLFNIGVELGQFAIIALAMLYFWALGKWAGSAKRPIEYVMTYSIAAIAAYWFIERMSGYIV